MTFMLEQDEAGAVYKSILFNSLARRVLRAEVYFNNRFPGNTQTKLRFR